MTCEENKKTACPWIDLVVGNAEEQAAVREKVEREWKVERERANKEELDFFGNENQTPRPPN